MNEVRDVVGIGLGPFNLGLAALLDPLDEVDAVFLERKQAFSWHPGLMLPDADVQVPFLADLVTLADPTSRHSVLNYLHSEGRLYRFYFRENMHLLRSEFQAYCRWVAARVASCRLGRSVEAAQLAADGTWEVTHRGTDGSVATERSRALVVGVGTVPWMPPAAAAVAPALPEAVLHSGAYMDHRAHLLQAADVTVVGAGQSAAEVVADLLENGRADQRRRWFTRGPGFLPMEYSKLGLEHFSPEYTSYFHGLPASVRDRVRGGQDLMYRGIAAATSARIYDTLYRLSVDGGDPGMEYRARCELQSVTPGPGGGLTLDLRQTEQNAVFRVATEGLVLATGYREAALPAGIADAAKLDDQGRLVVDRGYRVPMRDGGPSTLFVQNADLHTHGIGAPDLGLGAYRNAVIVNALLGREVYPVRARNVFQAFGAPVGP